MAFPFKTYGLYLALLALPLLNQVLPWLVPGLISTRSTDNFLAWMPYWGLGLLGLLGLQLNQTRILAAALWIMGTYFLFREPSFFQGLGLSPLRCLEILGATFPLSLALLFSFKESRLLSSETLFRFLLAFLPLAFLLSLLSVDPAGFQALLYWNLGAAGRLSPLPPLSGLGALVLALFFFNWKEPKTRLFLGALTVGLVDFAFALQESLEAYLNPFAPLPLVPVVLAFLILTLVLLHATFSMQWNRVYLDPLTGIPNRQALEDRLHTLTGRFTLAMMDIDHFKHFNDTYGHEEGDNVLRMVAQHLQEHLGERAFRYGGEEFCAVFDGLEGPEALELAEQMREKLAQRQFTIRKKLRKKGDAPARKNGAASTQKVQITLSLGLAFPDKKHPSVAEVLTWADQCLYQAKEKGRNRSVLAGS
ncbi:MAG TPA: GGDEF domain-containing protein [bacterium]|nr:GGDEF domain-containing protein [bacterium]